MASEVAVKKPKRKTYPMAPDRRRIGRGFKAALMAAGWRRVQASGRVVPDYAGAAEAINSAGVGIQVTRNRLSGIVIGRRNITAQNLMCYVAILGLSLRPILPHLFDDDGKPITRSTHPGLFRKGVRIPPEEPAAEASDA